MNNNKMKQQKQMAARKKQEKWSVLVGSALLCLLIISPTAYASDVEIYRQGTSGGNSTIMLMVDTSQGMGSPALDILKDYPLCISGKIFGVVNALPIVDVHLTPTVTVGKKNEAYCDVIFPKSVLDLLGTVDIVTGTGNNSLLGLQSSLDYMRSSCIPFSKLETDEPTHSNKILEVNLSLGEGYRCYSRLSRIKMAVRDVLDGNSGKGIEALSSNTTVGLSIFPAQNANAVNQKAGMILVPAEPLDDTQRAALKTAIDNLVPSSDPLGATLNGVVGVLDSVAGGLNIGGLLSSVVSLIGSLPSALMALLENPETPTATAYAETGAYLLGESTKGTEGKVVAKKVGTNGANYVAKCTSTYATTAPVPKNGLIDVIQSHEERCLAIGEWEEQRTGLTTCTFLTGCLPTVWSGWGEYQRSGTPPTTVYDPTVGWQDTQNYYQPSGQDSTYSGYAYRASSVPMKSDGNDYDNPQPIKDKISGTSTSQCQAQGIFVLTGNTPKIDTVNRLSVQRVMQKSLGKTPSNDLAHFCKDTLPDGWRIGSPNATWSCVANYSQALLDNNANYRTQVEIKTGVAGIGKEFNYVRLVGDTVVGTNIGGSIVNTLLNSVKSLLSTALNAANILSLGLLNLDKLTNLVNVILPTTPTDTTDIENLVHWGKDGKGGWYTEASTGGIAQSIIDFSQHIVDAESDPFMGLQTIPADPLTPYQLSDDVYNSIFMPAAHQSWSGNLKRYSATNTGADDNIIRTVDWKDKWNSNIAEAADGSTLFEGGMLGQLDALRPTKIDNSTRTLWINRNCDVDGQYSESQSLKKVTSDYLDDSSEARCAIDATAKDTKGGYLMNLLGYNVDPETATGGSLATSEPFWKIGMPLHSTPLKITQKAIFEAGNAANRDDYIVFGSTQGLLHVVNANDGKEEFAFVPNEMLENSEQRKAFTNQRQNSWKNMQYGVDGAWTAYTEYAYGMNANGKVYATVQQAKNRNGTVIATGKQMLYGGLRMGGRSYYALDLADLSNPDIKFHINPDAAVTTDASGNKQPDRNNPLSYMGQSWSKPTIAYVNWKGQRKQVMIVGGGYDMGYEAKDYNPSLSEGAGVYMFDANTGNLLWWASANATTKNTATENALNVTDMKYSVVSRINVADRDGDGTVCRSLVLW